MVSRVRREIGKVYIYAKVFKKTPVLEGIKDSTLQMIMERKFSTLIYKREFSYTHAMTIEYTNLRNSYLSNDNTLFKALDKQGKLNVVKDLISGSKDNIAAEYIRQLLWEYCSIEVNGVSKEYWLVPGMRGWHSALATKTRFFQMK